VPQPQATRVYMWRMAVHMTGSAACACTQPPGDREHYTATHRFALDHVVVNRNLVLHQNTRHVVTTHSTKVESCQKAQDARAARRHCCSWKQSIPRSREVLGRVSAMRVPLAFAHLHGRRALGCVDHHPVLLHDVHCVRVELPDVPVTACSSMGMRAASADTHMTVLLPTGLYMAQVVQVWLQGERRPHATGRRA
jgi:hypothetical protein